jgi:hypothetical protein
MIKELCTWVGHPLTLTTHVSVSGLLLGGTSAIRIIIFDVQLREWWAAKPDGQEECDRGCLCIANIDNESPAHGNLVFKFIIITLYFIENRNNSNI